MDCNFFFGMFHPGGCAGPKGEDLAENQANGKLQGAIQIGGERGTSPSGRSPQMGRKARLMPGWANEKFSEVPNSTVIKAMLLSTAVLARVALPCDSGSSDSRKE